MMRILTVLVTLLISGTAAEACRLTRVLTDEDLALAQSVFLGEVIDHYSPPAPGITTVTFRVNEVLSGREVGDEITVNMLRGAVSGPWELWKLQKEQGPEIIVGILFPDEFPETCIMRKFQNELGEDVEREWCYSPYIKYGNSENAWVMSKGCSNHFLFPAEDRSTFR